MQKHQQLHLLIVILTVQVLKVHGIVTVGTIGTGTWNGDVIAEAKLQNQSGTNTGDQTIGWHGSATRIKILHSDFVADDGGRPVMIDDTGVASEELFLESHGSNTLYVTMPIPTDYTATHVMIYGSGSTADAVEVWEHQG